MSSKNRVFSVAGFLPEVSPFTVAARSEAQLARRLARSLLLDPLALESVANALWMGKPVLLTDYAAVIIPGSFRGVSYQTVGFGGLR